MGDITALVPDEEADFCILEEPEHLNWYASWVLRGCVKLLLVPPRVVSHRGMHLWRRYKAPFTAKAWMEKFKHVVGVIHTNYLSYIRSNTLGQLKEPFVYYMNQGTLLCVPHSDHRDGVDL
jgi:digalactosyldiacylglycerol synthase